MACISPKILVANPPMVPSYFNAGHHLPLFQVSSFLRTNGYSKAIAQDFAALKSTWKDVGDILFSTQPDVLAVMCDFDGIDGLERLIVYARRLSPQVKIVCFGRLCKQIPELFKRFDIEAIAVSGDYESSIYGFVQYIEAGTVPMGLEYRDHGSWQKAPIGNQLSADAWGWPDVLEIPYAAYDNLYKNDLNKFCGIPERRELVVNVARGCPVGCSFCDVPSQQGKRERRPPVSFVLNYIEACFSKLKFDYVSFYAPTFTLDRRWVEEFCRRLKDGPIRFAWKCVTTTFHLDRDLVKLMAEAGCVRISLGIETMSANGQSGLPRIKRLGEREFHEISSWFVEAGIELNAFIILGLPNDNIDDVKATVQIIESSGGRVRPTMYTAYGNLAPTMSVEEVALYNRQLLPDDVGLEDAYKFYELMFGYQYRATQVQDSIPIIVG